MQGFLYIYTYSTCVYIIYVDLAPFCGDSTGRTWNSHIEISLEHLIFQAVFCVALGPEEMVIVWIANFWICFKTRCIKKITFLMSIHNLGFRILGFYHRVQWRGAKTGKDCWGRCHGLITSLWDFAQNCSLQIGRGNQNWRGTSYRFREGVHWAVHFGSHGLRKLIDLGFRNSFSPLPLAEVSTDVPTCGKIPVWRLWSARYKWHWLSLTFGPTFVKFISWEGNSRGINCFHFIL